MNKLIYEPSLTTHWKNLFPNKMLLLGSQNLNAGEELIAKIESVSVSEILDQKGSTQQVPVMSFTNAPPMVLNITNSTTIAALYGPHYNNWIGKSLQIYSCNVKAFGKETTALRIREAIPDTAEDVSKDTDAINQARTCNDLKAVFLSIPKHLKPGLIQLKDTKKEELNLV